MQTEENKKIVLDLCERTPRLVFRMIKTQHFKLWQFINENFEGKNFLEKCYVFVYGYFTCLNCNNKVKYICWNLGFSKHCSYKCSNNNTDVKEKRKQTNIKKYGVENPFQHEEIKKKSKKKRIKTWMRIYGVDNPLKSKKIKKKIKLTNLKRFGAENPTHWDKRTLPSNGFNKKVYKLLTEASIDYQPEFAIKTSKRSYYYDIRIDDIIIELHGDYWHCNPKKYAPDYYHKQKKITAQEIWDRDAHKKEIALNEGYDFIEIWESDFKKNPEILIEIYPKKSATITSTGVSLR